MKTMDDLRSMIFDTIDDVRKGKLDAATARAISELSQNVINSAKAEADYARATGQVVRSGLISTEQAAPPLAALAADALPAATTSVTRTHTDRGDVVAGEGNRTRHILK